MILLASVPIITGIALLVTLVELTRRDIRRRTGTDAAGEAQPAVGEDGGALGRVAHPARDFEGDLSALRSLFLQLRGDLAEMREASGDQFANVLVRTDRLERHVRDLDNDVKYLRAEIAELSNRFEGHLERQLVASS